MCLAIPGEVLTVDDAELRMARVSFGGAVKEISLALVPEAGAGDYVLVHAGFGIALVSAVHARAVFALLDEATR